MCSKIIDPYHLEATCSLSLYLNDPRPTLLRLRARLRGLLRSKASTVPIVPGSDGLKMQLSTTLVLLRKAVTVCLDWPVPADRSGFLAPLSGHQMS